MVGDLREGVEHAAFKVGIAGRLKQGDSSTDVIGAARSPNIAYAPHPIDAIGADERRIERHQGILQSEFAIARAGGIIAIHVLGDKVEGVRRSGVPTFGRLVGNQSTPFDITDSGHDFDPIDREHNGFLVEDTLTGVLNLKAQAALIAGRVGDPAFMDTLRKLFEDPKTKADEEYRRRVLLGYGMSAKQAGLDYLGSVIATDPSLKIGLAGVRIIGDVGGTKAISILEGLARNDPRKGIRAKAREELDKLRKR